MSLIFTDEELTKIENLLGQSFIDLYIKIWGERMSVKNYFSQIKTNLSTTKGHTKTYWEYKVEEIKSVLTNQTRWLTLIQLQLKGKISDSEYQRLEDYLETNKPSFLKETGDVKLG